MLCLRKLVLDIKHCEISANRLLELKSKVATSCIFNDKDTSVLRIELDLFSSPKAKL